jgi:hypothetical protein
MFDPVSPSNRRKTIILVVVGYAIMLISAVSIVILASMAAGH